MANIESVINWFRAREGRVTYDMAYPNRLGPNSYDCSSAVYYALIEAGFLPKGTGIGSTESLYALEGTLLQRISRSEVQRGDIFISGGKGTSAGANGHTGVFVSNSRIIHCNHGSNGISETSTEGGWMGGPPNDFYRLKGATPEEPEEPEKPKQEEEITMNCTFSVSDKDKALYYFDGQKVVVLTNTDQAVALREIYKQNNGKAMPHIEYSIKAPFYERLIETTKLKAL